MGQLPPAPSSGAAHAQHYACEKRIAVTLHRYTFHSVLVFPVKLVKPYKIKINCEWEVLTDDVNKSFWRQHSNHSGYADQSFNDTKANQYYIYFLYAYTHCDTNICEPKSNNDDATNSGAWLRYIRK